MSAGGSGGAGGFGGFMRGGGGFPRPGGSPSFPHQGGSGGFEGIGDRVNDFRDRMEDRFGGDHQFPGGGATGGTFPGGGGGWDRPNFPGQGPTHHAGTNPAPSAPTPTPRPSHPGGWRPGGAGGFMGRRYGM